MGGEKVSRSFNTLHEEGRKGRKGRKATYRRKVGKVGNPPYRGFMTYLPTRPSETLISQPTKNLIMKNGFTRGYFCAVACLIKENGLVTTDASSLFVQGGDCADADPEDLEVFREHGLLTRTLKMNATPAKEA